MDNFPHPRVNQTKQHTKLLVRFSLLGGFQMKSREVEDRSSSSGLVIWKPPKKENPPGGGGSFDQLENLEVQGVIGASFMHHRF